MVLTLLAILIAMLVAAPLAGRFVSPTVRAAAIAGISAALAVVAGVALATGSGSATLVLPVGPPGLAVHLVLDPLAASFLLLLSVALGCGERPPLALAGTGVALLAGDPFTLAVGLLLLGTATRFRPAVYAAIILVAALALAGAGEFQAIRAAPPDGWRAIGTLALTLAGAAVVARCSPVLAVYLLVRVLFDAAGTAQPLWWGVPLLLAGASLALGLAWRAALADTLHAAAGSVSLYLLGFALMALGVALFARASDLPSVAAQALSAVWLATVCHALCDTLLQRCADIAVLGGGTRRLDRMGGLVHRLPFTAGSCLLGLFAVTVCPLGLGFAAFWTLFQSLLAAARLGPLGLLLLVAVATAATALAAGLAALAAVRLFGVAFLGRPRSPRAAVADEAPPATRTVLGGLAGLIALLGVFPGLLLAPAAAWSHAALPLAWLGARTGAEAPGYLALPLLLLLGAAWFAISRAMPRQRERRQEAAWTGGFAAPPPWLPFGDPATQYGPASFVAPLARLASRRTALTAMRGRARRWRRAVLRAAAAAIAS